MTTATHGMTLLVKMGFGMTLLVKMKCGMTLSVKLRFGMTLLVKICGMTLLVTMIMICGITILMKMSCTEMTYGQSMVKYGMTSLVAMMG